MRNGFEKHEGQAFTVLIHSMNAEFSMLNEQKRNSEYMWVKKRVLESQIDNNYNKTQRTERKR